MCVHCEALNVARCGPKIVLESSHWAHQLICINRRRPERLRERLGFKERQSFDSKHK